MHSCSLSIWRDDLIFLTEKKQSIDLSLSMSVFQHNSIEYDIRVGSMIKAHCHCPFINLSLLSNDGNDSNDFIQDDDHNDDHVRSNRNDGSDWEK